MSQSKNYVKKGRTYRERFSPDIACCNNSHVLSKLKGKKRVYLIKRPNRLATQKAFFSFSRNVNVFFIHLFALLLNEA